MFVKKQVKASMVVRFGERLEMIFEKTKWLGEFSLLENQVFISEFEKQQSFEC